MAQNPQIAKLGKQFLQSAMLLKSNHAQSIQSVNQKILACLKLVIAIGIRIGTA
jgi:hypothetical protein